MTMSNDDILSWLELTATTLHAQRAYLTELDSAIGDADHGTNMDRGFSAIRDKLPTMQAMDIAGRLKTAGMTLVSTVGGASGPLYGTAYLRAAGAVAAKDELTAPDVVAMLEAFLGGVVARGKAQVGEKTMIDALTPAVAAAKQALAENASLADLTQRTAAAAETGMQSTVPLLATKGRASYLGERSIGHQDPGATSSWLILCCLAEVCASQT